MKEILGNTSFDRLKNILLLLVTSFLAIYQRGIVVLGVGFLLIIAFLYFIFQVLLTTP